MDSGQSIHPTEKVDRPPHFEIPQWNFFPYLSLLPENRKALAFYWTQTIQSCFLMKYNTLVKRSKTDLAVKVLFSVMGLLCSRHYLVKFLYEENWNKLLRSGRGWIWRKLLWKSNWKQKLCFQTVFILTLTGFIQGNLLWNTSCKTYTLKHKRKVPKMKGTGQSFTKPPPIGHVNPP